MENINLIRKLAWSFHQSTRVEYKELFAEACLAYCEAIQRYTPERGALSTFVWTAIENSLINFSKKERRYVPIDLKAEADKRVCYQPESFEETLSTFGKDCRKVAELMLQLVEDKGIEIVNAQHKMILWKTKKLLVEQEGWSHLRANRGIKALRVAVNDL